MATASSDGQTFKIKGAVDSSYTQAVQVAEQGAQKAAVAAKSWKDSLLSLASTLKSGAIAVGAVVLEQKNHYEMINAVTKATKDQISTCNQYTTQAIDPLKKDLQELVAVQKQYLAQLQQAGTAQVTASTGSASLSSSLSGLQSQITSNSEGFNTLKYAAQSAFYGNYTGAISELIGGLGGYAAAAGGVTAAIAIANQAMQAYEDHQKRVSAALDEESRKLQSATQSWKDYGRALDVKQGPMSTKFLDKQGLMDSVGAIRNQISNMSPMQVQNALTSSQVDKIGPNLLAATEQKDQAGRALAQLKSLQRSALNGGGRVRITLDEMEAAKAISADKAEQLKNSGVTSASLEDLSRAVREQQVLVQQSSRSVALLSEAKKKTDEWAKSLSDLGKNKDRIAEVNEVLKGSGQRSSLVQARDFTAATVKEVEDSYRRLTGGGKTDYATLQGKFVSGNYEERTLARILIERRRDLVKSNSEIKAFDAAKEREEIEAGQKQVARLQEQLELRRAEGKSSFGDTADTISKQLDATSQKDYKGRASLLNTQRSEHAKFLEEDFKTYVGTYQDAFKEISGSGTASIGDLTKANKQLAAAAAEWKKENAGVLDQFPAMKEKIEQILSSTRVESKKITAKTQEEAFTKLRQENQQREDAALNVRDRLKANEAAVNAVNEQAKKGLITQKQATEELLNLERQRAGIQRSIAAAMDEQKKAVTLLKSSLAGSKLQLLESSPAGPGKDQQIKESQREVLQYKLDAINQEYQAALKAGKDQALAAEEASLKKKSLLLQETAAFKAAEDAKTAAYRQANSDRLGGAASPLSGLGEGVTGSTLQFSGFRSFGEGFGSAATSGSLYSDYTKGKAPDHIQEMFNKKQSFELGPTSNAGTTVNVNLGLEAIPPNVKKLGQQIGYELAADMENRSLIYGDTTSPLVA